MTRQTPGDTDTRTAERRHRVQVSKNCCMGADRARGHGAQELLMGRGAFMIPGDREVSQGIPGMKERVPSGIMKTARSCPPGGQGLQAFQD